MGSFDFGFSCDIYIEMVCKGECLEFWFKQKKKKKKKKIYRNTLKTEQLRSATSKITYTVLRVLLTVFAQSSEGGTANSLLEENYFASWLLFVTFKYSTVQGNFIVPGGKFMWLQQTQRNNLKRPTC